MILSMELLMEDLMVKDALLKALLIRSSFCDPSDRSHDSLIGPFYSLFDVDYMVNS